MPNIDVTMWDLESNMHHMHNNITDEFRSVRNDIALNKSAIKSVENDISKNESPAKARFEVFTMLCTVDTGIFVNSEIDTTFQAVDSQLYSIQEDISTLKSQIHSLQDDMIKLEVKFDSKSNSVDSKDLLLDA